jgi:adenylate kinase
MNAEPTSTAPTKFRTTLLFGAPGSGKGTQGKILGAIPNFYHFSCGEVFRNLAPDSELGRTFLDYSSRGELVPDGPTIQLWRRHIDAAELTGQFVRATDMLILDGIPRNLAQAEMLKDVLDVQAVLYLSCPIMNKLVARLQRRALRENRLDDANIDIIRQRLETYERETKPVLEFYGTAVVKTIDSTQSPTRVLIDILRALDKSAG